MEGSDLLEARFLLETSLFGRRADVRNCLLIDPGRGTIFHLCELEYFLQQLLYEESAFLMGSTVGRAIHGRRCRQLTVKRLC